MPARAQVVLADSLEGALGQLNPACELGSSVETVYVIGGSSLYADAISRPELCQRVYLTSVSRLQAAKQAVAEMQKLKRDKAQELAHKDAEIARQKQKMEDMALELGEMLKETLDKMGAQIELSSSSWEADSGAGVARRLEDFKLGVSTDI